jgi:hypothetical protein
VSKPETEIIRRVYNDGHFIEVRDFPDAPDYLELRTDGENAGYFGPIALSMHPDFAMALGKALIASATEKGATA